MQKNVAENMAETAKNVAEKVAEKVDAATNVKIDDNAARKNQACAKETVAGGHDNVSKATE